MRKPVKTAAVSAARKFRSADGDDTTIHLRLTPEDRQRLRAILGFMLTDPAADRNERVGYAGALRYSMRLCVEHPPSHVGKAPGRA